MKKIFRVFTLLLVVILMSGCVKYNIDMKINKNKKMDMVFTYGVSKSLKSEDAEEDTEGIDKLKNEGWKVEEYQDDKYEGYKVSKNFADIDKLSSNTEVLVDLNKFSQDGETPTNFFQKKTENGKTVYVAKFVFSLNDSDDEPSEDSDSSEMSEALKQTMSTMDIKFSVEVPVVISSNATKVEENKLSWDLTTMEEGKNIEFSFSLGDSGFNFPLIPVIIGAGIIIVIVVVIIVLKSKKKNESTLLTTNYDESILMNNNGEGTQPISEEEPIQNITDETSQSSSEIVDNSSSDNNL